MKTYGKVTGMVAALAALAVSGMALGAPDSNRVTGKDKDKGAQGTPKTKTSVEVTNLCEPVESYETQGETFKGKFLKVTSTIANETGDGVDDPLQIGEEADVSQVQVGGLQLVKSGARPSKKEWKPVGAVEFTPNAELTIFPGKSKDYVVYLDLCSPPEYKLDVNATALNAEVQIMIKEGTEETVRNFIGNCDNPVLEGDDPDPDDGIDQDINDQSRIDIADYPWLACP